MQILIPPQTLIWHKIQGIASALQLLIIFCLFMFWFLFLTANFQILDYAEFILLQYLAFESFEFVLETSAWLVGLFLFLGLLKKAFVHTVILPRVTQAIIKELKNTVLFWSNYNHQQTEKENLSNQYQAYSNAISKAFIHSNYTANIAKKIKALQSIKTDNIVTKSLLSFTKGPNLTFVAKQETINFLVYKVRSQNNKYTKNILAIQDDKIKCKFDFIITKKKFFDTYKNKVKTEIDGLEDFVIYSDIPAENILQEIQRVGLSKIQKFLKNHKESKVVATEGKCYFLKHKSNDFKAWKIKIPKPKKSEYQVQSGMVFTGPEFDQKIPQKAKELDELFNQELAFLKY